MLPLASLKYFHYLPLSPTKTFHYSTVSDNLARVLAEVGSIFRERSCIRFERVLVSGSEPGSATNNSNPVVNFTVADLLNKCGLTRKRTESKRFNTETNRVEEGTLVNARVEISRECVNVETVTHEVLHVLGFGHVADRKDAGVYLDLEAEALSRNPCTARFIQLEDLGSFDCDSLMLRFGQKLNANGLGYFENNACSYEIDPMGNPVTVLKRELSQGDLDRVNYLHCGKETLNLPNFTSQALDLVTQLKFQLQSESSDCGEESDLEISSVRSRSYSWRSKLKLAGEVVFVLLAGGM